MNGRFVSYFRVSTSKQGQSGLGLDAQRQAVTAFLNGGRWTVLSEFVEIESGRKSDRPQLAAAIAAAKKSKATLIVAKLDRLARNLHFLSGLMESGVEFLAVDNPTANRLTVQILAAVAEDEARRISERTKAALASAKARGTVLGRNGANLAKTNKDNADKFSADLKPLVSEMIAAGLSRADIAATLNRRQIPTARGGRWHVTTVQRLVERLGL